MEQELVLLICPVRNEGEVISRLLDSLQAQTHLNWRLHVVDNASTDDTREVVQVRAALDQRIRLTCLGGPVSANQNWARAADTALQEESYAVAWLAGDDYLGSPRHLEVSVAALRANFEWVFPSVHHVYETGTSCLSLRVNSGKCLLNHLRLATSMDYALAIYGIFARDAFEEILSSPAAQLRGKWFPAADWWWAFEAFKHRVAFVPLTLLVKDQRVRRDYAGAYYEGLEGNELPNLSKGGEFQGSISWRQRIEWAFQFLFVEPYHHFVTQRARVLPRNFPLISLLAIVLFAARLLTVIWFTARFPLRRIGKVGKSRDPRLRSCTTHHGS